MNRFKHCASYLLLFISVAVLWRDAVTDAIYCSQEFNATCRINHLFSNDCSRSELGKRFPGLYNNGENNTERIDTFLVEFIRRDKKLGFVLEIRPSLHKGVQSLQGYEILMTNVTESSTECYILVFALNLTSSKQKTKTVKTILFPVMGTNLNDKDLKQYSFKASTLPASSTKQSDAKRVYVNAGDSTEVLTSQWFITSIAYINDSNTRSIYVNFEKPPAKFGFMHFNVKLRNRTYLSQYHSLNVNVNKSSCQFIDLEPGQYIIEVEPETSSSNYMHCQDRNGFQQMCSITNSETIILKNPESLSVIYEQTMEYRTISTSTAREHEDTFQNTTFLVPHNASGHLVTYSFHKEDSIGTSNETNTIQTIILVITIITVVSITTALSIVFFCRKDYKNRKRHNVNGYDHTSIGHVSKNGMTLNNQNNKAIMTVEEQWKVEQDQYLKNKERKETVQLGIFLIDDDDTICNPSIHPAETILAVNMDELNFFSLEGTENNEDHKNNDCEHLKPVETIVCSEPKDFVSPEPSQMDDIDSQCQMEQIVNLNRRYLFQTAGRTSYEDISNVITAEQNSRHHKAFSPSHQPLENSDSHFTFGNKDALDYMVSSSTTDCNSIDFDDICYITGEYDQMECSHSFGGLSV